MKRHKNVLFKCFIVHVMQKLIIGFRSASAWSLIGRLTTCIISDRYSPAFFYTSRLLIGRSHLLFSFDNCFLNCSNYLFVYGYVRLGGGLQPYMPAHAQSTAAYNCFYYILTIV